MGPQPVQLRRRGCGPAARPGEAERRGDGHRPAHQRHQLYQGGVDIVAGVRESMPLTVDGLSSLFTALNIGVKKNKAKENWNFLISFSLAGSQYR